MQTLTKLNTVISQLQQNAAVIGFTLAGLMIIVYAMIIMFSSDTSPTGRQGRWEHLQKVVICAIIIAATGALVQFATSLGKML